MAKKVKNNRIPLPILIIVCTVLLYAIYTSISTLVLAIGGTASSVRWIAMGHSSSTSKEM
jgi:hypothetical protein